jgi:hypothetical protein
MTGTCPHRRVASLRAAAQMMDQETSALRVAVGALELEGMEAAMAGLSVGTVTYREIGMVPCILRAHT